MKRGGWTWTAALLALAVGCKQGTSEPTPEAPAGMPTPYFQEFALDHPGSGPAIVAVDEQDAVWVALAKTGKLARFSNGSLELFPFGPESRPVGVAVGAPGTAHEASVWVAASYDNKLIRFDRTTREKKEFPLEGKNTWPFNVALGPDGSVWFTQRFAGQVGRLDPASGSVRNYPLPNRQSGPAGLAVDARSGRVWFTEGFTDTVGSLDPATGAIREWRLGTESTGVVSGPAGLAVDAQGGVWFAKLEGRLGYLAPDAQTPRIIEVPAEARRPAGIAVSPSGDVWTLALDGNLALRYRPSTGAFTSFPMPTGAPDLEPGVPPTARSSRPFGLGFDKQGNLWFSEQYAGKLGVLDLAPPSIQVLSPAGVAEGGRTMLSVRITDRVSGVRDTEYRIDGVPVTPVQGFLELVSLTPGPHILSVQATDGAGQRASVESRFEYRPGRLALQYALSRLRPVDLEGQQVRDRLVTEAERLGEQDVRDGLTRIRRTLGEEAARFHPFPLSAYQGLVDFIANTSAGDVEVRVLDTPPYFDRRELVLRPGDSVRWRYDSPNTGHTVSTATHALTVEGGGQLLSSGLLKSGDRFTFKFERPGQYVVKAPESPDAVLAVKVGEP
ncbi:hypothetical protein [Corallococcus sp. Z5C101001]|uniref:virginiamycin B lyase family protein n=1 Tax=Corallococcus sp. Z5C101001 TaxID=2596829 RepID=UPI00117F21A8|nr:hypothetical protein [Corallococcus sp. Z5C101001]TSC33550.1 hypothetical protein FOF48_00390 [Corallococcus sp. Z5C101001]